MCDEYVDSLPKSKETAKLKEKVTTRSFIIGVKGCLIQYLEIKDFFKTKCEFWEKMKFIPFSNGVGYDSVERNFRKTTREDFVAYAHPAEYEPNTDKSFIIKYLTDTFGVEQLGMLKNEMKDCFLCHTYSDIFLYGKSGSNGKSTFVNFVRFLMGDHFQRIPLEEIIF